MRSHLALAFFVVVALASFPHTVAAQTPCGSGEGQVDLIVDDVEGPSLWTATSVPSTTGWSISSMVFRSSTRSWFSPNLSWQSDQRLTISSPVAIPASTASLHLAFWHRYDFEAGFDGGVVEFSVDGGTTWSDVGPHSLSNGYNRTLSTCCGNPLKGRRAFSGSNVGSPAFLLTTGVLPSPAGAMFSLRFRTGTDSSGSLRGWNVDDVHIYACVSAAAGSLAFGESAYSIGEDGGSVTIAVERTNGSDGAVAVNYATSIGTAAPGVDYNPTSGTLAFANGETSKTFEVPVFDDFETEPPETIGLALSNPTGGATLGTPSTAVLTISDNCPVTTANQPDFDGDGVPDECDPDDDNDGRADVDDPHTTNANLCGDTDDDSCDDCTSGTFQPLSDGIDTDADGECNAGDADDDGDGVTDAGDNCPLEANSDQANRDGDAQGDVCDQDGDNDGVADAIDACPATPAASTVNATGCAVADICPCSEARNHGQYVSCVTRAAGDFVEAGLITNQTRDALVNAAARSSCGRK